MNTIESLEVRLVLATAPFNSDLAGGFGFIKLQSPQSGAAQHIATQPDGKMLVSRSGSSALQRYFESGKLDSSFAADPWVKQHHDVPAITVLADGSMMYSDGS